MTTKPTGRPVQKRHEMGGHLFAVSELAALAGCSAPAMARRLSKHSPAQAVAMGASDRSRPRGKRLTYSTPTGHHPAAKFYTVGDETLTLRQLAQRAGCGDTTMISRLRNNSPEKAIAMGPANANRPRKAVDAKLQAKPKTPKPVKETKPPSSAALSAKTWTAVAKKKADKKATAPSGPAIVPKGLVIQREEPKHGRFYVDPKSVPSHFGRIGQYLPSETVTARRLGGA